MQLLRLRRKQMTGAVVKFGVVISGIVFHASALLMLMSWLGYEVVDAGFLVVSAVLLTVLELMLLSRFFARSRARTRP